MRVTKYPWEVVWKNTPHYLFPPHLSKHMDWVGVATLIYYIVQVALWVYEYIKHRE